MGDRGSLGRLLLAVAWAASAVLPILALAGLLPGGLSTLEVIAVTTGAWSVWYLAHNHPFGWWVGLVSVAAFAVVFYRVRLYAEVGIQVFYFVTSLQAIWIWLRGGAERTPRPVTRVPRRVAVATVPISLVALVALRALLIELGGAVPFWDALTVVMSLTAHVYLMWRYVESWWLWLAVDVIFVPLYASRGLLLTSVLYVGFFAMSCMGLRRFRRELIPSADAEPVEVAT